MIDDLYRSETLVVRRVAGADRTRWFVTFDHHSIGEGFDRPGFGEEFLRAAGWSALHVLGRGNDWYQYPDLPRALAAARRELAGADRIVTYGSSMGGYAAVRFAHLIGAHAAIALSPQYSLDPKLVSWETRWSNDIRRIAWRPEWQAALVGCPATYLVFDPVTDRRHADLIAGEIAAVKLPLPYAGHPAACFVAEVGLLRPLLRDVLADRFDADNWWRRARAARRSSPCYLSELALRLAPRRLDAAIAHLRAAMTIAPGDPRSRVTIGSLLTRQGRHAEAVAVTAEAVALTQRRDAVTLVHHAYALAAARRFHEAICVIDEAVVLSPAAHLSVWRAGACWRAGDWRGALASQWRAVRQAPHNVNYRLMLLRFLWRTPIRLTANLLRHPPRQVARYLIACP